MPVLMPWAEEVAAILQVWLPGQAFGEALAGVLLGTAEPGGRLPVTLPRAEADSPVLQADPQAGELHLSQISGKVDPNKANPLDKKPAAGGGPATKPKDMPTERKTAEKKPAAKDEMDDESKAKGKAKGDGGNPLDK